MRSNNFFHWYPWIRAYKLMRATLERRYKHIKYCIGCCCGGNCAWHDVYIYIYIYMLSYYIYIYTHTYIYTTCVYIYIYIYTVCVYIYIYIYTHMYIPSSRSAADSGGKRTVCMHLKASVYIYIYIYV